MRIHSPNDFSRHVHCSPDRKLILGRIRRPIAQAIPQSSSLVDRLDRVDLDVRVVELCVLLRTGRRPTICQTVRGISMAMLPTHGFLHVPRHDFMAIVVGCLFIGLIS